MRRVLVYLIIVVAVLLLAVAVVVQGVLWSDVPRRIVAAQLEEQLGLTVTIDDVSTGWLGRTRLEDLHLSLPLADRPIVEAAVVEVDHAALLWLVITGDLALDRLEVDGLRVAVRQGEDGQWNVEQLAQVLQSRLGGDDDDAGGPPTLPDVVIRDAAVQVLPHDEPGATIRPVQVRGEAVSPLRYKLTVEAPQVGTVSGHVALGEPWTHEVSFDVLPDAAASALLTGSDAALGAAGKYRGTFAAGVAEGELELGRAFVGQRWIQGRAAVRFAADAGRLSVRPEAAAALHVAGDEPVQVTGGELSYVLGQMLRLNSVLLAGWGVEAVADGEIDPRRQSGDVTLTWRDGPPKAEGDHVDHRGRATLTMGRGVTGRRRGRLEVEATARTPWGEIDVAATGQAYGAAWDALDGRLMVNRLGLQRGGERFHLDNAAARFEIADGRVRLVRLRLPSAAAPRRLAAQGYYDLGSGTWALEAEAASFALPGVTLDGFSMDVLGSADRAELRSATVRSGGVEASAAGAYVYRDPQPLSLNVTLDQVPIRMGGGVDAARPTVTAENLGGELHVRGVLSPMDLEADGELVARSLRVGEEVLGDFAVRVSGDVNAAMARFVAEAPQWLGGRWRARGVWERAGQHARIELTGDQLDLRLAQEMFDPPVELTGLAGLAVTVDVPQATPGRFLAEGTFHADGLTVVAPGSGASGASGGAGVRIEADRFDGRIRLDRKSLRLTDVRLVRGESAVDAQVTVPLTGRGEVEAAASLHDWPVMIPRAEAVIRLAGDGEMSIDRATGAAAGRARMDVQVRAREVDLGAVTVEADVAEGRLTLGELDGEVLGGTVQGSGVLDLAGLTGTDLTVAWQGVEPAMLVPWAGPMDELHGRVSGRLTARYTDDPRAIGPLKMEMQLDARETTVRGLILGDGSAVAYTDGERLVLETFALQAAGGEVELWGRISRHAQEWFLYASAAARDVDLAALTAALAPQRPVLGRLDAELTVSTPLDDWRVAFGHGQVELRESDLANIPLFGALFNLVNLRIGAAEPDGRGRGDLRIEEGYFVLNSFRYQNRGTQINLAPLRIADIWAGEASPIAGFATLTQNLLPELEFFGTVNEALAVLQSDLVAARIDGTLGEPQVKTLALRGVTGELRDIITGGAAGRRTGEQESGGSGNPEHVGGETD